MNMTCAFSDMKRLRFRNMVGISQLYCFVVMAFSLANPSQAFACPSSCYCDEEGEYVSCVGDGLWSVPSDLPTSTTRLELRNYLAQTLSAKDFQGLQKLQELKLQQSQIESIDNATFAYNEKLQRLDLSQNRVSLLSTAVFKGLQRLRFLDLSSNFIEDIEEAFSDLVNLEQLNLRDNRILQLTTHTFTGLHKIQYLNLDANNISFIEVGTFQYLTNLAHLIISNNPLNTLSRLDFFGSRLQFIDISHVGLDRIPQSLTKFVRDLRLAKNNLTRISAGDFDSYPYLGLLVLDDNCVSEIENDALGRQEYLMRLWLNGNCLTKVPPNLPPSLLALYMEENKLTELPSYSFKGLVHLEQLFLQRNSIQNLEICAFCDLGNLKSLDLQANQIENLTSGIFTNLTQLATLDLSQNNIKVIDTRCFDGLNRLKTLQMSRVPTVVKLDDAMFDPLQNLLTLEVYDSPLLVHKILNSTRMLHGLRKVQELNIMHNRILRLRSDFPSFLPSLKIIKMSGNQWHCDKDIVWLSTWIKQSNVQFYSSYSIRCASPESLQFKPLMMITDSDFIESTTVETKTTTSTLPIADIHSSTLVISPSTQSTHSIEEQLAQNVTFSLTTNFNSQTMMNESFSTIEPTNPFSQSTTSSSTFSAPKETPTSVETSTDPKFISAYPYRYTIVRQKVNEQPINTESNTTFTYPLPSSTHLSTSSVRSDDVNSTIPNVTVTTPNMLVYDTTFTSSFRETTTPHPSRFINEPQQSTPTAKDTPAVTPKFQSIEPERAVLSSRLRGWTNADVTSTSSPWDNTTTIIVSAIVSTGGILVLVGGLVTLLTLLRCRHRYQPVKHRNMRRSSSISYYPQKDEVSIVTLTEGTVGLKTNSHHGLGNKLYYIMENGGSSSTDAVRDALPDPQLQELLPQSPINNATLY